jgi:predicted oxidoreductase
MDQADIYGGYAAEEVLGHALKSAPALRDQIEIVTKCDIVAPAGRYAEAKLKYYDTSADHIRASVDHSLRLMNIEQIDMLLIHRPDPFMDHFETGRALGEVVASGKVRAVGVSNLMLHYWRLLQSSTKTPLTTNQIEISLAAHDAFTNGDVAYLQERNLPIMAWSPLGGGDLMTGSGATQHLMAKMAAEAGVDAGAIAVAWLLAHPANILPVMGTNNLKRISSLSDALKVRIDRQQWYALYTAALGHEVA